MEKLKKLFLSQTIKDTSISFLGLGFSAAVGFVFTIIAAKYFGPESFGIYSAVVAFMTIVFTFTDLGISSSLINFLPKNNENRNKYISTGFFIEIICGLVALLIFLLLSLNPKLIIPGANSLSLIFAGFLGFNYVILGFIQSIFTADRKFVLLSASQIVDAGIRILIILILVKTKTLTPPNAFVANIISTIFSFFITYKSRIKDLKIEFHKEIFDKIIHFAKWIALTRVFSVFVSRVDVILLNLLTNSFEAGIYSAANRITFFFSMLISSLGSVVTPRFSAFDTKEKINSYIKKLLLLVTLVAVGMLSTIFLAKPIIVTVFGQKYVSAIPVFQALALAMIPFIYTLVTTSALIYSFNKPSFIAKMTVLQVISISLIDLIFIPKIGAFAPPIALGFSNLLVLVFSSIKLKVLLEHEIS